MTVRPVSRRLFTDESSGWVCDQGCGVVAFDHDCRENCPASHGEQCCGFPAICREAS